MKKTLIFGFLILVAGIAAGFLLTSRPSSSPVATQSAPAVDNPPAGWVKGAQNARVVLSEYSDFQCPACALYHPVIQQLSNQFGDRMRFEYHHFPLRQIHPNAELAAAAAEAAGNQQKFWEMSGILFERQTQWSSEKQAENLFTGYAAELSLDQDKFQRDLFAPEIRQSIDLDLRSGQNLGVNATPTFFLNGAKIENPRSYNEFRSLIEKALTASH